MALTLQKISWKQKEEAKNAIAASDILFKGLEYILDKLHAFMNQTAQTNILHFKHFNLNTSNTIKFCSVKTKTQKNNFFPWLMVHGHAKKIEM